MSVMHSDGLTERPRGSTQFALSVVGAEGKEKGNDETLPSTEGRLNAAAF
jgi:hypothetical protein